MLENGTVTSHVIGDLPASYAFIPGVLHACRTSTADLGDYTAAVPEPTSRAFVLGGLLDLAAAARRWRWR